MSLLKGTGIVSSLTTISRGFGFVRDLLLARLFGAGPIADAFFVAFRIPNLLRSFLAEGALTSAFVPVFAGELERDRDSALRTLRAVATLLLIVTSILSVCAIIWAPVIIGLIAPGFESGSLAAELCVLLTRIMIPYIVFVSLTATLNGAFNSVNVFGMGPLAQITMNCTMIFGILIAGVFEQHIAVQCVAWSVLIGGVVQILVQVPALLKARLSIIPTLKVFLRPVMHILSLMIPAMFGAAVYQISVFINTALASTLPAGSVSWLFYADRVAQLPIGIFTLALASVLLPRLSTSAAKKDEEDFSRSLVHSLRFTSFVIFPIAGTMIILAEPAIGLLFERGAFTAVTTHETARALIAYSIGIWGVSCYTITIRAFLSRKDTLTPALLAVILLAMNIFIGVSLMGPPTSMAGSALELCIVWLQNHSFLTHLSPALGHVGLALASSLSTTFVFLLALILVLRRNPAMRIAPYLRASVLSLLAGGASIWAVSSWIDFSSRLLTLLSGSVGIALLYFLLMLGLRAPEARETLSILRSIFKRAGKMN